mmetsp:Transcript_89722/g.187415  ORF Transcript_89722/g.187415 Transcript_89722/m.187415 type:complete len:258 (+) Transcript_89722:78-851(+)
MAAAMNDLEESKPKETTAVAVAPPVAPPPPAKAVSETPATLPNPPKPEVTGEMIRKARRKQRKAITFQVLQLVLNFLFGLFYWIFYNKSTEACESRPVKMKTVFLSFALLNTLSILLTALVLASSTMFLAEHYIKGQLYKDMGRKNASATEEKLLHETTRFKVLAAMGTVGGIGACGTSCVMIFWGVACFLSALNAAGDSHEGTCDNEVAWWWALFVANLIYAGCQNVWGFLMQPNQTAELPIGKKKKNPVDSESAA